MTKSTFIAAAFLLVLASLLTHCIARGFLEESMHRRAARIRQVAGSHTTYVADPLATQAAHTYKLLTTIGIVFTAMSVVCMVTARIRREPGWYLLLLLLLTISITDPTLL